MALELAWLKTWVSVVDCGGFTRAAEQTHLSQPRVSAHIASLERELGCQLIERRVRPLTLTDDGRALLAQARAVLAAADELVDSSRAEHGIVAGSVNVASFVSGSSEFLPAVLTKLKNDHPQLNVGVLDGDVGFIETALSERRVSVALRPLRPEPRDRALAVHPLWREPFVVLAPCGQHDDRRLRFGANLAAQAEAVLARQHHVEDQQIDAAVGHRPHHFAAVACRRHVAGIGAQIFRDQRSRFAVVFDDKDVGRRLGHANPCR